MKQTDLKKLALYFLGAALPVFLWSSPVFAVDPPDAGQTLQELRSAAPSPKTSKGVPVVTQADESQPSGGPRVTVNSISFRGNAVFPDERLLALVQDAQGKGFDLAGLQALAGRITTFYHEHDYPFARALIPAQSVKDGVLEIEIIEGRYGEVKIVEGDRRERRAGRFLNDLNPGEVIKGQPLERVSLLLNDQPGYSFISVIRPGQKPGTGDLSLKMQRENLFSGGIRFDNHGNRYTGRLRMLADLSANSLLLFGDQLTISGVYAQWNTWLGGVNYNLPIGSSGLRGFAGYNYSYYQLGKEFDSLDAHGVAQVISAGLNYSLIRSQKANLSVSAAYQHKMLKDEQDVAGVADEKSSNSMPVLVSFDLRDNLWGGGITYGVLGWTYGMLHLNNGLAVTDSTTAGSNGSFNKLNLDISRIHVLPENFSFFARIAGQKSFNNLDSSEDFGLGGPNGVRAFPTGEGYGDEGLLTQGELRYKFSHFTPYGFYDFGLNRTSHDPWSAGDNDRTISGAGFGLRINYGNWNANCSFAWRVTGGQPESDSRSQMPAIWFNIGYRI